MPVKKDIFYVAIQLILFGCYLFRIPSIDFPVHNLVQYIFLFIAILGAALIVYSIFLLNKNLTPFPSPVRSGSLITVGVYKYIRHPIYTGILLVTLGFGVYSENTLRLIVFVLLVVLFIYKARYEEKLLIKKFPGYIAYKNKTAALLPVIY